MRRTAIIAAALAVGSAVSAPAAADSGYFFRPRPLTIASKAAAKALEARVPATVQVQAGIPDATSLAAAGGTAPYTWSGVSLPNGLTVSAQGAVASASPGTFPRITAKVRDAAGAEATATFDLVSSPVSGGALAFGSNAWGQSLPNSTTNQTSGPVAVNAWTDWTFVSGVNNGSCGIRSGALWCWGHNGYGALGANGDTNVTNGPMLVDSSGTWSFVTGSYGGHACGLKDDKLYCWGANGYGQTGVNGKVTTVGGPKLVDGGTTGWSSVTLGNSHTCAIRGGHLYCWGGNYVSQLGYGGTTDSTAGPRTVNAWANWTAVAAGQNHTCGIAGGKLYCWGHNLGSQVGNNSSATVSTGPLLIDGGSTEWTALAIGNEFSCGLRGAKLYCWGNNSTGAVGTGGAQTQAVPAAVGNRDWTSIAAGGSHACGISDGELLCWGANASGQAGVGGTANVTAGPQAVSPGTKGWKMVRPGMNHTLALR